MNPRRIRRETAAFASVDVESLDRHVVGADAHDASCPGADEAWPPLANETHGPVKVQISLVRPARHFDQAARRRLIDPRLEGRALSSLLAAFGGRRARDAHRWRLRYEQNAGEQGVQHGGTGCFAAAAPGGAP